MNAKRIRLGALLALLVLVAAAAWRWQAITDWVALRDYTPPTTVSQLAAEDTMTPEAEHLFYVNHPRVVAGASFSSHCPSGSEKTVVLGCYLSPDKGIYVYAVDDPRLTGVEQVTAAHEMLHAAYRRLSSGERSKVDGMLEDYYKHDLTDQRIKDTIAAYQKSEPHDVVNEMHSVFGTEVADLPASLERYYKRYFTNRAAVTTYTANYQNEFTSRQAQIAAYDAQLAALKRQIDGDKTELTAQRSALDAQAAQLQQLKDSGQIAAYNQGVDSYNTAANTYNESLAATKDAINQYNTIVAQRNSIVLEAQELTKELSSSSLPD